MISLALWFLAGCSLAFLGYHLITFVIELISFIGECIMGDNGGIIIWIILIVGGLIKLLL